MIQLAQSHPHVSIEFGSNDFFRELYVKMFPSVAQFIRKQNGSLEDAKDVFHDALIIFYEKKISNELEIELTDEAYVFGIVKHLWIRKAKDHQRILLSETESAITLPEEFETDMKPDSLVSFLKSAGERCMMLLQAFYYERKSMVLIRSAFGFSCVRSATVEIYK